MNLDPVITLVPGHSNLLKVMQKVYRCVGMLPKADNAQSFIHYGHRNRRPLCHNRFYYFMAVHAEYEDSIVFKSDEVVIVAPCCAIHLKLILVLFKNLHILCADHN